MILCGITSLIIEKDFFVSNHPIIKIPFYGFMGIAISFSVTFSICDIINYTISTCLNKFSKPIIYSHA